MQRYLITLQVPDRPGLVEQIAQPLSRLGGNWLDSELRHIDTLFAAILVVEIAPQHWDELRDSLEAIDGLTLTGQKLADPTPSSPTVNVQVVGNDRSGFVHQISNMIAAMSINIERFSSSRESASHTGLALFKAELTLSPVDAEVYERLQQKLFEIGDDVQVDLIN
ncbi:glycine cleavage system protein R [Paraferrimonas haliotis]|uniref:Glycine cleavage system transcriptional repressor n=1 Tax=Paraferrimonas haliotis TaxID=2013866 RepID=A0AA37TMF1_9GAMM|nr:ACT domain-containing protein [Paraferrimonas haliotis]GLS82948.1 amino acid-binding protein [Paraferrimonas haliotis]